MSCLYNYRIVYLAPSASLLFVLGWLFSNSYTPLFVTVFLTNEWTRKFYEPSPMFFCFPITCRLKTNQTKQNQKNQIRADSDSTSRLTGSCEKNNTRFGSVLVAFWASASSARTPGSKWIRYKNDGSRRNEYIIFHETASLVASQHLGHTACSV